MDGERVELVDRAGVFECLACDDDGRKQGEIAQRGVGRADSDRGQQLRILAADRTYRWFWYVPTSSRSSPHNTTQY